MNERQEHLNTDELQADDEISPRPPDGKSRSGRKTISHATNDEAEDTTRVPRAANSD